MSEIDNERLSEPGSPPSTRTKRFLQLAKQRVEEDYQRSIPKTQRVPAFLRENAEFAKYCTPKIISFGPIHHGEKNLEQGEDYKLLWTYMYIEEYSKQTNQATDQVAQSLLQTVQDKLGELKKLFTEDAIGETTDEDFAWMLFVDGCSLLHLMENIDIHHPEALKIKLDQMTFILRDTIMLENQLPTRLLELLRKKGPQSPELEHLMFNFLSFGQLKGSQQVEIPLAFQQNKGKPHHLLDHLRSSQVTDDDLDVKYQRKPKLVMRTYKSMRDLRAAGIRVKPNEKYTSLWNNVSFKSMLFCGELRLPMFVIHDASSISYRNMIAYEMCPDFHNNFECCSFLSFMDSLIDDGEDVKELRSAGVIKNLLGSDDDLAKFFVELGRDVPTRIFNSPVLRSDAIANNYAEVTYQTERHYKDRKRWLAYTYFRAPWSIFTFLHAIVAALILSSIQTWYTVHPKKP